MRADARPVIMGEYDLSKVETPEQVLALRAAIIAAGCVMTVEYGDERADYEAREVDFLRSLRLPPSVEWLRLSFAPLGPESEEERQEREAREAAQRGAAEKVSAAMPLLETSPLPGDAAPTIPPTDKYSHHGPKRLPAPNREAVTVAEVTEVLDADPQAEARRRGLLLDPVPGGGVQVRRARDQQPLGVYPTIHAALAAKDAP